MGGSPYVRCACTCSESVGLASPGDRLFSRDKPGGVDAGGEDAGGEDAGDAAPLNMFLALSGCPGGYPIALPSLLTYHQ